MWQRIQTVFLGALVLCLIISLIQPIWQLQGEADKVVLTPFYVMRAEQHYYVPYVLTAILSIASITLAVTSIRKYSNRITQMRLGALNSLLLVGVVASSAYFASQLIQEFKGGEYGFGLYLPAAAVLCNLLANFFIRRDERLVRDSERLR